MCEPRRTSASHPKARPRPVAYTINGPPRKDRRRSHPTRSRPNHLASETTIVSPVIGLTPSRRSSTVTRRQRISSIAQKHSAGQPIFRIPNRDLGSLGWRGHQLSATHMKSVRLRNFDPRDGARSASRRRNELGPANTNGRPTTDSDSRPALAIPGAIRLGQPSGVNSSPPQEGVRPSVSLWKYSGAAGFGICFSASRQAHGGGGMASIPNLPGFGPPSNGVPATRTVVLQGTVLHSWRRGSHMLAQDVGQHPAATEMVRIPPQSRGKTVPARSQATATSVRVAAIMSHAAVWVRSSLVSLSLSTVSGERDLACGNVDEPVDSRGWRAGMRALRRSAIHRGLPQFGE